MRPPNLFGIAWKGRRYAYLAEVGAEDDLPIWQRRQRVSGGGRSGMPTVSPSSLNILHAPYLLPHHVPRWPLPCFFHISDGAPSLHRVEPLLAAALLARHFLFHVP